MTKWEELKGQKVLAFGRSDESLVIQTDKGIWMAEPYGD